jgi:hypothetical protein
LPQQSAVAVVAAIQDQDHRAAQAVAAQMGQVVAQALQGKVMLAATVAPMVQLILHRAVVVERMR